jgi:membrane-bound metal-dependent hydrolase YbcI (DUF457 family)
MDWRSHALIGALSAAAVLFLLGTHGTISLAGCAVMGALSALAPDLDLPQSKGRRMMDLLVIISVFLLVWFSGCGSSLCVPGFAAVQPMAITALALLGAYFLLFTLFKPRHRGITHSLLACAAFGVLAYLVFGVTLAAAALVGYASHLLADNEIKIL